MVMVPQIAQQNLMISLKLAKLALFITNCGMQALSYKHSSICNVTGTNGHMFT